MECSCHTTKIRDEEEKKKLINRLSRIEGQVRGVRKMIDEDTYCIDVLTQVSAISSALNAFSKELLSKHLHTCVIEDIKAGKEETVDELLLLFQKMMK